MKKTIGTREWAMANDGALQKSDRTRLMAQAMLARLALVPTRARAWLGLHEQNLARIDADALRIPDSAAAVRAGALMESLSPPWLANHCWRTYLWGAMLAQSRRIKFDEELLYVATALHDLGLTDSHKCSATCAACFAVEGARAAERFSETIGWSSERRERLSEAISLHLNITVSAAQGREAHLLHAGAGLDVIGARAREIDAASIRSVLQKHPRLDFKTEMTGLMKEEARSRPLSRAAFLVRDLGFNRLIRAAPWSE